MNFKFEKEALFRFRICNKFDSVPYLNTASPFYADPDSDPGPDPTPEMEVS